MSNLQMKILAKETAIYGVSSIMGKFLNWMLVPLYTYVLQQQSDYGIVTNLYAWTALLLVVLTYGMETGFFRFMNKEGENPQTVYSTSLITLFTTSLLFAVACVVWQTPVANVLGYPKHSEFIAILGVTVAIDAFASIPFAYLRYKKRPLHFAALKLLFVFLNIALNLFFLVLCPKIQDWGIIASWYNPNYGVGYVFVANILATGIQTLFLLPAMLEGFKRSGSQEKSTEIFSYGLLKQMLKYSLPLLVLGVCGIMNQTLDRILFPFFYTGADAQSQLGIYGACFKVAMVMAFIWRESSSLMAERDCSRSSSASLSWEVLRFSWFSFLPPSHTVVLMPRVMFATRSCFKSLSPLNNFSMLPFTPKETCSAMSGLP